MSFKDLSSRTPVPANDKAKPVTAKPGKSPAEGARRVRKAPPDRLAVERGENEGMALPLA